MHRRLGVDRRWMSARGNRVVMNEAISRRVNRNRRRRGLGGGRVLVLKNWTVTAHAFCATGIFNVEVVEDGMPSSN